MFNSSGYVLRLPRETSASDSTAANLDLNAMHHFWFGRQQCLASAGLAVQALVLLIAGVFLLTQMSSTPNLVVQIALAGGLMTIGAVAVFGHALGNVLSGLKIDRKGVRVRLGWRHRYLPWSKIERWSVSDERPRLDVLPGITLWSYGSKQPLVVPDYHLDDQSRHNIQWLMATLACGKEAV